MIEFLRWTAIPMLLVCLAGHAMAERPEEKKETADYILTAEVDKVFKRREGRLNEYVVLLNVHTVHRGKGVKGGESFFAYCFQMTPSPTPQPEASGHDAVPAEGQLIKAYLHRRRGWNEGNYSHWFEVLKEKKDR